MNVKNIRQAPSMKTVLILSIFLFLMCGCFKKEYVGMNVDTREWERYLPGYTHYVNTGHFEFEIKIIETGNEGEYYLEGTLDGKRGSLKSISALVVSECDFRIILASNNVVVDNFTFFPVGNDHRNKLPFKRTFTTVPFDSFTIVYEVSVSG